MVMADKGENFKEFTGIYIICKILFPQKCWETHGF